MRIGHFQGLWEHSGVSTTVGAIIDEQKARGHTVYYLDYAASEPFALEHGSIEPYVLVEDDHDLFATARQLQLDLLHVHHPIAYLPEERVPVVRTVHNFQPLCPSRLHFLKRTGAECHREYGPLGCLWGHAVDRCGARRPDRWLNGFHQTWQDQSILPRLHMATISNMLREAMIQGGYPADRIAVTPMFTARNERSYASPPQDGPPRFLYMGRLVEQKGLSDLVAAVANLEGSIGLDVAGEGPYRSVLERQIDDLGLADRVRMHGWVDPARCVDLLQGARALVVPSVAPETAGAVVIESAAQGRAVIASDIGGLPEYAWDEETAIVVPPGDVAALTNAIGRLAGDWTLADRMGRRGYEVARKVFSIENHLDRLHDLYVRSIREQNVRQATHMSLPG